MNLSDMASFDTGVGSYAAAIFNEVKANVEKAVDGMNRSVLGRFAIDHEVLVIALIRKELLERHRRDKTSAVGVCFDLTSMAVNRAIKASQHTVAEVYGEAYFWGVQDQPEFQDAKEFKDAVAERYAELKVISRYDDRFHDFFARGYWDIDKIAKYVEAGIDYELAMSIGEE